MKKIIGENLKKLRIEKGLNQNELAEILHITQASLSAYETKTKLPSLDVLFKISDYFSVSLDWLCGRDSKRNSYTSFENMAEVILSSLFISKLSGLHMESDITRETIKYCKEHDEEWFKYYGSLTFESLFENSSDKLNYSLGEYFCKFLFDLQELKKQLNILSDFDIKKNYFKMWLEKKLKEASSIGFSSSLECEFGEDFIFNALNELIKELDISGE